MRIFLSQPLIVFSLLFFFPPLIVAHCTGTIFPEIREAIMAGMAIGPSDVDAGPRRHVHLHSAGFSSFIERYRHRMAVLRVGVHPDFRRSCRARLQAGTVNSSTCLPKGERYRTWPQVPPQTLIWRASSRTRTRSYRNTDSRKTPMFEFNAPVREISDGLRVRNDENRVPLGV